MFHTFDLYRDIDYSQLHQLASILGIELEKDCGSTKSFYKEGIRYIDLFTLAIPTKGNRTKIVRRINITLNPKVLIEQYNSPHITNIDDIEIVKTEFNDYIQRILGEDMSSQLGSFDDWGCSRIDYAVDIIFGDPQPYVKLLKRSDNINVFFTDRYRNKGGRYLECKSTTVNFYPKKEEIEKHKDRYSDLSEEEIREMDNIIRFEIQCKSPKLNNIKKRFGYEEKSVQNMLTAAHSQEIILYYYDKLIGEQDFYSLTEAEKIINVSDLTTRLKHKLIDILRLIAQTRSISNARDQYVNGVNLRQPSKYLKGKRATFNENLREIRKLGINPITIPRKWGLAKLDNPRRLILEAFGIQPDDTDA